MSRPGLSQRVVEEISAFKTEPPWMREFRLNALAAFRAKPTPSWGGDLRQINYDQMHYYLRPTDGQSRRWEDVPADIKETFDRLGIPEAERKALAGVKAQYDSEVIYGSIKKSLERQGVIFLGMDEGLQKHSDLVKAHFGKLIPPGDNKFAALNSAVWSGGSFVYVPPGVEVKLPLQAYFRINAPNAGQFERTLIIADEGAKVHYVEGCFIKRTMISGNSKRIPIEQVRYGDRVLTHTGEYRRVNYVQKRKYTGRLYSLRFWGDSSTRLDVTEVHPFLFVPRQLPNERNFIWKRRWGKASDLSKGDYLVVPVDKTLTKRKRVAFDIDEWQGKKKGYVRVRRMVPSTPEFFRLAGYYLAEGSISSGAYLNFSFSTSELDFVEDIRTLMMNVFGMTKHHLSFHKKNNGVSVVFNSTELCRIFEYFGKKAHLKRIPDWMLHEHVDKQRELVLGLYRGDGNYYDQINKHGRKEIFRLNTVSEELAYQLRAILLRLGIVAFLNTRNRDAEGRRTMYVVGIAGEQMLKFGQLVGVDIDQEMNQKKRATKFGYDRNYAYLPIREITSKQVRNVDVYNFGVEDNESYVAGGVAVHNCTAPAYSSESLHAAVVEIFVKRGARVQYTTVQNWYKTVYNLVTKRTWVEEEGEMIWTDFNMGSKLTMKYPSFILAGRGAHGETLSMAMAGEGQHQDTGSKAIHLAPYTTSTIISKSVSRGGGRTSYRGLVSVGPKAQGSKSKVVCDALILDPASRSDTYPTNRILTSNVQLAHEATVSKIGEEQLFYLMSRGFSEQEASKMIVSGFVEPLVQKLPLEYAVEMNRLIDLEMEGSVG